MFNVPYLEISNTLASLEIALVDTCYMLLWLTFIYWSLCRCVQSLSGFSRTYLSKMVSIPSMSCYKGWASPFRDGVRSARAREREIERGRKRDWWIERCGCEILSNTEYVWKATFLTSFSLRRHLTFCSLDDVLKDSMLPRKNSAFSCPKFDLVDPVSPLIWKRSW